MPIASSDIQYFYSMGSTGASGASTAGASLGGTISTTQVGAAANNVWDDVTGDEASAGDTEYRCLYVKNNHGSLALQGAVLFVDGETTSTATTIAVGLDPAAVGANSTTTVANENTAPGGVAFSATAVSRATGLSIGNIPAGQSKAFWLRRTVTAGATAVSDSGSIRVEGDTAA